MLPTGVALSFLSSLSLTCISLSHSVYVDGSVQTVIGMQMPGVVSGFSVLDMHLSGIISESRGWTIFWRTAETRVFVFET